MDEQTILVTGGAGFVGQHLLRELRTALPGVRLVVWDKYRGLAPAEYRLADIADSASWAGQLALLKPTWLIHLAAVSHVSAALHDPSLAYRINVAATERLLQDAVAESPQTRIVAVSSADIYGRASAAPLPELPIAAAKPLNPYAASKRDMEALIAASFADRTIVVRPFPHIGPGQGRGLVTADFAAQIAAIEAGRQEAVIKVGNLAARRDFTDVRDVVRAYRLLLTCGQLGETYHVASGRAVAIHDVLRRLLALSTHSITIAEDPARLRPADIPVLVGDASKLTAATAISGPGWKPEISLDQSLRDILQWWREQEGDQ
ncbi:MAG: hypothetical protein COT71_04145 [Candidatus Andersenbacteria bacterium CG10_big_fil_rev_8_21_14_0_10_54_11]|uniref:NAD(P)-binding domain-containing protein n=1 Tax=Candidatus Andersenbacteria bacterium CG10_big_fil_rev_8_21_14_0_10_54_11 TaxID=1974485 RepID=A0A2M6WYD4_9BACT|nr:MAG: hypothetical protein COT71_04145 [Candidatus Andersenbacteria bacterium CG10_big_fil_rev_8_21_14_0_10_54_11]